jgi:hypothetical protein
VGILDPWESVPAERRLDFGVIREPLERLTVATILNLKRALPPEITRVPGAAVVLLLLAKVAATTFDTIRYFCAERPEDPARRISFASSAPPLLRSLLDGIYTVVFIGEDVGERIQWYYRAGWREMREEYERHRVRYGGRADWDDWLRRNAEFLDATRVDWGVTADGAENLRAIQRWPTPPQMIRSGLVGAQSQAFFEYMEDWFYREFSQEDHLSLPGLIRRASTFLRAPDEQATENEWKKKRSDWFAYAVVLLLAFLAEIILLCGFDLKGRCAYLWGILREYSPMAAELFQERYEGRLAA